MTATRRWGVLLGEDDAVTAAFDVPAARRFVADNHSQFDLSPESAERWLVAALDEIERLTAEVVTWKIRHRMSDDENVGLRRREIERESTP